MAWYHVGIWYDSLYGVRNGMRAESGRCAPEAQRHLVAEVWFGLDEGARDDTEDRKSRGKGQLVAVFFFS